MPGKRYLSFVAKLVFSATLLALVLFRIDTADILTRIKGADPRWLIAAFLAAPLVILLSAWRWQVLSLGLLRFWEAVRYTWIGLFFGSILPGMVGGDVAKGVSLASKNPETRDARLPVSIGVDKLVGLWALLFIFSLVGVKVLGTLPVPLAGFRKVLWLALGTTGVGLVAGIMICQRKVAVVCEKSAKRIRVPFLRNLTLRLLAAITTYQGRGTRLVAALTLSFVLHAANATIYWAVLHSLAIPASLAFAAIFYCLLSVLLSMPVSISGIGVRDAFSAALFGAYGLRPEAGVAFSWLLLVLGIPGVIVGGLIQVWEMFQRRRSH